MSLPPYKTDAARMPAALGSDAARLAVSPMPALPMVAMLEQATQSGGWGF